VDQIKNFLGVVKTQLDRSEIAYNCYIAGGRCFLYAKILKKINEELRDLLVVKSHLLPVEQAKNALALIHHLDVWSSLWEDAYILLAPSLTSNFEFQNEINFPAKEVQNLVEYYENIRLN
jgi:hypothetical protein